jgi:hypothetical protein
MKDIFIVWGRYTTTVMDVISVPAPAINIDALRAMHRAPVIQTVKQTIQLLIKKYAET